MNKTLYIVRGLPGSGKSTFAKELQSAFSARYYEADMFFIDDKGNYNFDASKLYNAHQWCQHCVRNAMTSNVDVIVSNTSTTEKEVKDYTDMAAEHGYRVVSLVVENRHGGINTHNVPADKLKQMRDRFSLKLISE